MNKPAPSTEAPTIRLRRASSVRGAGTQPEARGAQRGRAVPDAAWRVRAQQRLLRAARSPAPLGGKSSGWKSSGSLASGRRKGSSKAAGVEGTAAGLRQCVLEASALLGEPFTFCFRERRGGSRLPLLRTGLPKQRESHAIETRPTPNNNHHHQIQRPRNVLEG